MAGAKLNLALFLTLAVIVSIATAEEEWMDELWQKRAQLAKEHIKKAYHPNPLNVTFELNKAVHESLDLQESLTEGSVNSTRRYLGDKRKTSGACQATNPIDKCWRCDKNWEKNRKRLADCVMGFARNTKGGKAGDFYVVTDSSDDPVHPKIGTLRHAVIQERPLWIIFKRDMVIHLKQELIMTSDKTIDGRGAKVFITKGAGFMLQYIKNVIIHGIHMNHIVERSGGLVADWEGHLGKRQKSDGDAIQVFGSSDIWIDHVSMSACYDGLIDVVKGSTGITISNSHFTDHNDVMLLGASDTHGEDKLMQVTIAFNHFGKRLIQRMPRCRFGFFHVVNNDYTHWEKYAIGGTANPTIISQGNRYIAPNDRNLKEITKRQDYPERVWKNWIWRSEGDVFMNGAFFVESGDAKWTSKHKELVYSDKIKPASGSNVGLITKYAGALGCKVGSPC